MSRELAQDDKQAVKKPKPIVQPSDKQKAANPSADVGGVLSLQQRVGNQAVQRFLAQRSDDGGFALDDETSSRINQARGGGHTLDGSVQTQMGEAMGHDFSDVRVHTSAEANNLNEQLSAKAFTTGQDIFFKEGAYNPGSSAGQELLAHELTHVVQQSQGLADGGGSGMTVNPPGDVYEQEADAVAQQVTSGGQESVQTALLDEGAAQREELPEEELDEQTMLKRDDSVQREELLEEELDEQAMLKRDDSVQRSDTPEEELL